MSKDASAADEASPISDAEANWLFRDLGKFPVLVLAVSGGPDSTALMMLAARWRATLQTTLKLVAVTVDHGLRRESKREAKAVERLARKLGIAHRTLRWTGRKPATGLQEAARLARYRLLARVARKTGARHVLTAHTLDDQAETVLFRLARGSGVSGLAGMRELGPVPISEDGVTMLARPLLRVPKSRLIATLKAGKIAFADDPSNRDPRFARPRLRALMPALAREGLTAVRLAALARRVQQMEDALLEVLADAQARIAPGPWPDGGPVTIAAGAFSSLPDEVAQRLLAKAIAWSGEEGPVELGKIEVFCRALRETRESARSGLEERAKFRRTLAGAMVTLSGDRIVVEQAPPRAAVRKNRLTTRSTGRRKGRKHQ